MSTKWTPEQTALFGKLYDEGELSLSDMQARVEAMYTIQEPEQPPAVYDIAKIRKAYNRVQAALTEAKKDGDTERMAKYRADYLALKDMLAKANEEQRGIEERATITLRKQLEESQARLKAAHKANGDLKFEITRLTQEIRELRAPAPTAAYDKARFIKIDRNYTFTPEDLLRDLDAL